MSTHPADIARTSNPDLSILVVSYNTRELTLACLASVYEQTRDVSFEVIVVDNHSSDGSADAIAERFPRAELHRSPENVGFARANNLAATHARGAYLLLLNPDTRILEGAIDEIVGFARAHPELGIYGGRTVFEDGSLNPASCWARMTPWSLFCKATGLSILFRGSRIFDPQALGGWARDSVREVDIVSGCFLLLETPLWRRLGGFDPAFFMYGEDADLCLRARRLGCRPTIDPAARLVHHGGASEPVREDKIVRLLRAQAELVRRHWPRSRVGFGLRMLVLRSFTRAAVHRLLARVRGRPSAAADAWTGVFRRRAEWLAAAGAPATPPAAAPARGGASPPGTSSRPGRAC